MHLHAYRYSAQTRQNRNRTPPCTNRGDPVVTRPVAGSLPTAYVELKRFSMPRKISPAVASGKGIGRQRFTLATKKLLSTISLRSSSNWLPTNRPRKAAFTRRGFRYCTPSEYMFFGTCGTRFPSNEGSAGNSRTVDSL